MLNLLKIPNGSDFFSTSPCSLHFMKKLYPTLTCCHKGGEHQGQQSQDDM
jgi:hypothetical protein